MTAETTTPTAPEAPPRGRPRRLLRSRTNRVLAGVCGGIAERYGSDATAVRLAALIIALFTGIVPMVVAYIVAAIVVPDGEGELADVRAGVGAGQTALVFGALLVIVGIVGFANVWLQVDWEWVWPLAVIGLGAVLLLASLRPRSSAR